MNIKLYDNISYTSKIDEKEEKRFEENNKPNINWVEEIKEKNFYPKIKHKLEVLNNIQGDINDKTGFICSVYKKLKKHENVLSILKPKDFLDIIIKYNLKIVYKENLITKITSQVVEKKLEILNYICPYEDNNLNLNFLFSLFYKYNYSCRRIFPELNIKTKDITYSSFVVGKNLIYDINDFYEKENIKSENLIFSWNQNLKAFIFFTDCYWKFEMNTDPMTFSKFKNLKKHGK